MCGGAAVFGAACYLAQVKPKNKVVAPSGQSKICQVHQQPDRVMLSNLRWEDDWGDKY